MILAPPGDADGSQSRGFHLDELVSRTDGISAAYGSFMAEAAKVCLEDQRHGSGVLMALDGFPADACQVHWERPHPAATMSWADPQEATEYGAMGIAALLMASLCDLRVISRSRKGTACDFFLRRDVEPTSYLFQDIVVRLEVSGIQSGSRGDIASRQKSKYERFRRLSAQAIWTVIVEFGRPHSLLVQHAPAA